MANKDRKRRPNGKSLLAQQLRSYQADFHATTAAYTAWQADAQRTIQFMKDKHKLLHNAFEALTRDYDGLKRSYDQAIAEITTHAHARKTWERDRAIMQSRLNDLMKSVD